MRGFVGELRCGYNVAARLGAWSLVDGRFEGAVHERDDWWLGSGGPFDLWLAVGDRAFVWRNATVSDDAAAGPLVAHVSGRAEIRNRPPTLAAGAKA